MRENTIIRRGVALAVITSFMSVTTACYGPFNLTRNVYHWNSEIKGSGEVNEKWMKEFVFFGMIIIPVYMISALLDAFIFNSLQFWTGNNPVKISRGPDGQIEAVQFRDQTIHVAWSDDHRSAAVTYRQDGQVIKTALIVEDGNGYRLTEGSGQSLYRTEEAVDGGLNIVDGECRLVDHVSFDRLQQASIDLARSL
ncbi:MAG TPA: DUF3332 family protein [Nitrospiraceae bacterium]|nr:DUF3332 family protein [Nitrospiraceae bacterium]